MAQTSALLLMLGFILLVYGTVKAVWERRRLHQMPVGLLVFGAVADCGFALFAFVLNQSVGAVLFLLFQLSARSLAIAAWRCTGTLSWARGLCALGLLAAVGGSPFLVPEGRFFITQALALSGNLGLVTAVVAGISATIFVWLHLNAVREVFLALPTQSLCACGQEHGARQGSVPPAFSSLQAAAWTRGLMYLSALAVIAMGIFRVPLYGFVASLLDSPVGHAHTQGMSVGEALFMLLFVGAALTALCAVIKRQWVLILAAFFMAASFVLVLVGAHCTGMGALSSLAHFFALIITGIGFVVALYSAGYMQDDAHKGSYATFLLLTFAALVGIVTTTDLGVFYGYWELMTFASWFLVVHDRHKHGGRDLDTILAAGTKYYVMCAGGALIMLPGLAVLGGGHTSFVALPHVVQTMSPMLLGVVAVLTLTGFAAKAGMVPLHSWLPDAHPAAPSPVSAPLSGVITKMGVFGIAALLLPLWGQGNMPNTGVFVSFLGALTLVYGECMALRQDDIKRLLAYSTLGQVGEICLVLGVGTWLATTGALVHVFNHAIMKDLLFLGAGVCILRTGSRKLADLRGLGAHMPWTVACMAVGLIAIMGLPPFAGFFGKYLMIQALLEQGALFMACVLMLGSLVGAVYYVRILRVLVFEKRPASLPALSPLTKRASICMNSALGILAAATLLLGLFPQGSIDTAGSMLGGVVTMASAVASHYFSITPVAEMPLRAIDISWPLYVMFPFMGIVIPLLFMEKAKSCALATAAVLLVTAGLVLVFGRELDTLSFAFALMVPLMGALNMAYASSYMDHSHTQWRFYAVFLCMCGGLIGMASARNLLTFFVFWEIMSSWTLYMTLAHEGTKDSMGEAFKYFLFNLIGAAFLFVGIALVGGTLPLCSLYFTNTQNIWPPVSALIDSRAISFGYVLLTIGFVMKAAQLPWRIDWQMHPALAPTPVSGFISSVLLKSAVLGLIKLFAVLGSGLVAFGALHVSLVDALQHALMWIGGVTLLWAAIQALRATKLKLIFIYSTVSQIGYMVLAIGLGTSLGYAGSLLHVANHMLFKDLLFLVCGALMYYSHKDDLRDLGGLGRKMPFTMAVFAIAGLCVVGVPPSNGFSSKWLIYHALMASGETMLALISLLGSVLTLAYIVKFLHAVFLGQPRDYTEIPVAMPLAPSMRICMGILALACVVTGVFPGLFLYPINEMLSEYGLAPLAVSLSGIETGVGAWNATALAVMMFVAVGGTWWILNTCVTRHSRITQAHMCGLTAQEGSRRMPPNAIYGGLRGTPLKERLSMAHLSQTLRTIKARFLKENGHD